MADSREHVNKGLQYLKSSDHIVGEIVSWCVNAYKADPSPKTVERVRQYVQDTANSVSEHVLTIAHHLSKMLESEVKEIEQLTFETGYVSHRLQGHQNYMCNLFMTKFKTYPRPKRTIHILRRTLKDDELPKYARAKRPWVRQQGFDYKILDTVGARPTAGGGTSVSSRKVHPASPRSQLVPSSAEGPATTAYQQFNKRMSANVEGSAIAVKPVAAPPMFSAAKNPPASTGAKVPPAIPSGPPAVPSVPPVPMSGGGPPPVPPVPPAGAGGPPPVPPVPSGGGPPPVPPVPSGGGPPPVPPAPFGGGGGGGPPPVPPVPPGGGGGAPPEELQRFLKMLKLGVPKVGVINKMTQEGLDPALLDQYS